MKDKSLDKSQDKSLDKSQDIQIFYIVGTILFIIGVLISIWADYRDPIRPSKIIILAYTLTLFGFIAVSISHYREGKKLATILTGVLFTVTVILLVVLLLAYKKKN